MNDSASLITSVLLTALIGFGLAYTGAKLDGPLGMAKALRWLLRRPWLPGWVRNGADCPFCWSFWFALLAAIVVTGGVSWPEFVIAWLAGFGLACFLLLYTGH